ncbi:MAG: PAS domain S-box protein, partial [Acidobacteria bacterium]|nr:PAS domain S-box protein [Acidobacteriota bacterium]
TGMAIFARAQRGETGLVEGPDYRGVDAIAVIRPVPNSPWTLVTKIDREELHQQLWQQVVMIGSLTLAVLVATGSTLVWMWRAESRHVLYQRASMAAALGVSEARAHRVAGLYATLSQCNEAIVRSSTEAELFPRVCRSTVQHGGMAMAWIGLMRPDDSVLCVAAHGTGADRLKEVGVIDCASAAGPTHTALRGGHAVWTSDCEHAPPLPWEAEGRSLGWSACAALPLCRLGRTVGALTIYAFSADAFDDDGRRLLQELANNISFALDNFDRDARREEAESALREKERFLSESQRIAHVGSWVLGPDGPTSWSDEMFQLFDLPATGHPPTREAFLQRVHPDDHDALFDAIAHAWASRAPVEFEHRLVMDDGSIRYLVTRAEARQSSAAGDALEGATQDITERRTAELARRETEARYRNLVDHAPVAIFVNRDDKVVLVNDACVQLFGAASPSDLLGRSPLTLFDPAHSEAIRHRISKLRTHGTPQAHQPDRIVRMDGSMLDVEISAAVFDDAGVRAIHVALIDTSDRLRAEELLRGSVREKEALLKEVHHRVKNNLQVITSLLRLESGRSADAGVRTVLGEMQDRILSMALLHETLYRSGTFASIDLARYVTQLAQQIFRSQTPSPAIMLRVQAEPTSIELDQAIPCGLLVNELVSNALKHGFPGRDHGQVSLTLARVGTELHLEVADNGIGLPANFDTKRAASLGLQLVSDLTRQLRGTLHVGPGPGASFRVTFTPRPAPPTDSTDRTSS